MRTFDTIALTGGLILVAMDQSYPFEMFKILFGRIIISHTPLKVRNGICKSIYLIRSRTPTYIRLPLNYPCEFLLRSSLAQQTFSIQTQLYYDTIKDTLQESVSNIINWLIYHK